MVENKGSQPGGAERRLQDLGIHLTATPTPLGSYVQTVQTSNLLFFSGMLPIVDHKPKFLGRLGKELDVEAGREAVYIAALNVLGAAKEHLGSLDRVRQIVSVNGYVNAAAGFPDPPAIINGASDLLVEIFGDEGRHARAAIGVSALPRNALVEVQMIVEI